MSDQDPVDALTPNVARMYDFFLGGKDNYEVDRVTAAEVLRLLPDVPLMARENRAFLRRAVRFLAAQGIRQFIDIGTGLPTQGPVHEIAHEPAPDARVVYVDNDPVVLTHARALLSGTGGVTIIQADARRPAEILGHPEVAALIDFGEPVAVLMLAILHFIDDADEPHEIVARLRAALAPGSFLAVSHVTADHQEDSAKEAARVYDRATASITQRTYAEVSRFFEGMELVEPGLTTVSLWRPEPGAVLPPDAEKQWGYAGVARLPAAQ